MSTMLVKSFLHAGDLYRDYSQDIVRTLFVCDFGVLDFISKFSFTAFASLK